MSIGDRKRLVEMGIALWQAISEQNASQDCSFCMPMETDQPITLARADSREKKKKWTRSCLSASQATADLLVSPQSGLLPTLLADVSRPQTGEETGNASTLTRLSFMLTPAGATRSHRADCRSVPLLSRPTATISEFAVRCFRLTGTSPWRERYLWGKHNLAD